jgi:hypothetical protein
MTYCVVRRDPRSLAVADANDPRIGPYVQRVGQETFWDYIDACDHAKRLAVFMQLEFAPGSILNDKYERDGAPWEG